MKEPVVLAPDRDGSWSQDELIRLVDSIRWFRAIGSNDRRELFIGDRVPRYDLNNEMFELLMMLQSGELLDEEIHIYASDFDMLWTWKVCASPLGLAVWRNVERSSETSPAAA